jgi:hypothetical protein
MATVADGVQGSQGLPSSWTWGPVGDLLTSPRRGASFSQRLVASLQGTESCCGHLTPERSCLPPLTLGVSTPAHSAAAIKRKVFPASDVICQPPGCVQDVFVVHTGAVCLWKMVVKLVVCCILPFLTRSQAPLWPPRLFPASSTFQALDSDALTSRLMTFNFSASLDSTY